MTGSFKLKNRVPYGDSPNGYFVLENGRGETVRTFRWETETVQLIYRWDTRRVETVADLKPLTDAGVKFDVLSVMTKENIQSKAIDIGNGRGRVRWVQQIPAFTSEHEMLPETTLEPKVAFGWSAGIQIGMALAFVIAGFITGTSTKKSSDVSVTLIPKEVVQKMLQEETTPRQDLQAQAPVAKQRPRDIVVAPTLKKIRKNAPVPTQSTSFKRTAKTNSKLRGGGYKSDAPRGYGTNERHMNQIGALGALNKTKRVHGGNGGSGGLNLQAVGTEPGSGAGGKGYGGFGNNGGGGRGLGGLGTGTKQGLANAMYGKGLIAAPFGEGSPAPGSGGYGTRGKMGGGAQGAGYGTQTIVGSWKGTGPKGNGPAGSGVGNGDPNGSPFGTVDGDDDGAVVTGGLDMESIREIINRNMGQIRYCYEQGLQKQPSLSGRVTLKWQIAGNGRVSIAGVRHSSVRSAQVESCMIAKLKNWQFPKPHGGVNVAVVYPFNLQRTVSMR